MLVFDLRSDGHLLLGFGQLETRERIGLPFVVEPVCFPTRCLSFLGLRLSVPVRHRQLAEETRPRGAAQGRAGSASISQAGAGGGGAGLKWHWGSCVTM